MSLEFLNNPIIKNVATKQLKKHLQSSGTTMIAVALSESGELSFTEYSEPVTVMSQADMTQIRQVLTEYSVTIQNLKSQLDGKHD